MPVTLFAYPFTFLGQIHGVKLTVQKLSVVIYPLVVYQGACLHTHWHDVILVRLVFAKSVPTVPFTWAVLLSVWPTISAHSFGTNHPPLSLWLQSSLPTWLEGCIHHVYLSYWRVGIWSRDGVWVSVGSWDSPMVLLTTLGLLRGTDQAGWSNELVAPLFREIPARLATARTRMLYEPKQQVNLECGTTSRPGWCTLGAHKPSDSTHGVWSHSCPSGSTPTHL